MGLMQTDGRCSHCGGHQWQWQQCCHGMGWVPILQQQWQWKRMGLMQSNGSVHTEGGWQQQHICIQCEHSRWKINFPLPLPLLNVNGTFNLRRSDIREDSKCDYSGKSWTHKKFK